MSTSSSKNRLPFSPAVSFYLPDGPPTPSSLSSKSRLASISAQKPSNHNPFHFKSSVINNNNIENHEDSTPDKSTRSSITQTDFQNDNSMTLLPPAQTIGESLAAMASTTADSLGEVWDEIGYSPEERADQINELLYDMRRLCEEKIVYEKKVRDQMRDTIKTYMEEIRFTCKALHQDVDEELLNENSKEEQSLMDQVMTLEIYLEKVRSVAKVAREDLRRYREQLVEDYQALGMPLDESWKDVSSDLTQARCDLFLQKMKETDSIISTRISAVVQLLQDCQELLELLECDVHDHNSFDYKIMHSLVTHDDGSVSIKSKFPSEDCVGITSAALQELTDRVGELNAEKKRRRQHLNEMGEKIYFLWEKLQISMEEQLKFTESVGKLGMDTLTKGEEELKRLYDLKYRMMGKLIFDARERIRQLWDETNATEKQMLSFDGMKVTDETKFNDSLLDTHELYIQELESRLELMKPLLIMIEKREAIILERMEYEELQKDPERLQQRGAALTKQLMKEEKMCRRIKKDLPKFTDHLEKKLQEWESNYNEVFLYKGRAYIDVMKEQEDEWQRYKDEQLQLKMKKKMEDQSAHNGGFQSLPGKKASVEGSQKSRAISQGRALSNIRPLGDGTNRMRAVSRPRADGKSEKGVIGNVMSKVRAISRGRGKNDSESRSKSRGRVDINPEERSKSRGRMVGSRPISRGRENRPWTRG